MSKAQTLVLFLFFIFSIDDKDGTHLNGFNTSMRESSERNMCYCTEPLVGGFTPKAGIFYHIFNLRVIKKKEHKHIALHSGEDVGFEAVC